MSPYFQAPAPNDLGRMESSVMGMPPGRQICPPCVCPLRSRSNPACAACRYISGVWDKKNRELFERNRVRGFLDIVHPEIMGIVDTRQMNPLAAAFDDNAFIEQHSYPHPLQVGDHTDRVMVAQNAVHWSFQSLAQRRHPGKGLTERSECFPPIVAGEDTEVVFQARKEVTMQAIACSFISVCRSLRWRILKPSKALGTRCETISFCLSRSLAAFRRPSGKVPPAEGLPRLGCVKRAGSLYGRSSVPDRRSAPHDPFRSEALTGMQTAEALLQPLLDIARVENLTAAPKGASL